MLSGSYEFDTYIDLGAIQTCYIQANMTVSIYDSIDLFDYRSGNFDAAEGLFDGADISGVQVQLFIRTTDDDPSGAPTWSSWYQFFAGDFTNRAFEFKIEVTSDNSAYQIDIEQLGVTVDTPDITESGTASLGAGSTTTVNLSKTYVQAPDVAIVINDLQDGDELDFTPGSDITTTNFTVGVLNSASYVARSITYFVRGH